MAETFGKTTINEGTQNPSPDIQYACKYTSGSAGDLESISLYVVHAGGGANIKCAIFDGSLAMLSNGATEEKTTPSSQDGWMEFNFPTPPTVLATTVYWLAWWFDTYGIILYREEGAYHQALYESKTYNTWNDPLTPDDYFNYEYSLYATYYEPPPPLPPPVQVTLI